MSGRHKFSEIPHKADARIIEKAGQVVDDLSRPMYVFRMARANPTNPSAHQRLLNASREILQVVGEERSPELLLRLLIDDPVYQGLLVLLDRLWQSARGERDLTPGEEELVEEIVAWWEAR